MNATVEVTAEVTYKVELVDCASLEDAETQAMCLVEEHLENLPDAVVDLDMDIFDVDSYETESE